MNDKETRSEYLARMDNAIGGNRGDQRTDGTGPPPPPPPPPEEGEEND